MSRPQGQFGDGGGGAGGTHTHHLPPLGGTCHSPLKPVLIAFY